MISHAGGFDTHTWLSVCQVFTVPRVASHYRSTPDSALLDSQEDTEDTWIIITAEHHCLLLKKVIHTVSNQCWVDWVKLEGEAKVLLSCYWPAGYVSDKAVSFWEVSQAGSPPWKSARTQHDSHCWWEGRNHWRTWRTHVGRPLCVNRPVNRLLIPDARQLAKLLLLHQ